MMMRRITFVVQLMVLGSAFLSWVVSGSAWEIKTITGGSYSPPRFALSLRDHNIAFTSSVYCVTTVNTETTIPNGFPRDLCEACTSCTWKQRHGFTTELEWQAAVNAEMARLDSGDLGHVGSWILEVPVTMELSLEVMDELSSTLGISLENLVVAAAADDGTSRRYFVVSATPENMTRAMLYAEFISATPIPPRLKIHPILEEAAAIAERSAGLNDDVPHEKVHGLCTQLAHAPPAPPLISSIGSAKNISCNNLEAARAGGCVHPLLDGEAFSSDAAIEWVEEVASRHGRAETAEVVTQGEHIVTVRGLHSSWAVVYAAALDIAMHGAVHWVAPHAGGPHTPTGYYASKVSQKWPPTDALERPQQPNQKSVGEKQLLEWDSTPGPLHELGFRGQGAVVGVFEWGPLDLHSCFFRDGTVEVDLKTEKQEKDGGIRYGVYESKHHRKLRLYAVSGQLKDDERYWSMKSSLYTHGTSVAGALAGKISKKGREQGGPPLVGEGVAPDAKLAYFFMVDPFKELDDEDEEEELWEKRSAIEKSKGKKKVSWDLRADVFPRAYRVGTRVFSVSWERRDDNQKHSSAIDAYLFRNQDFVVLTAAGNDGTVRRTEKEMSWLPEEYRGATGSVFTPADSKSVVAVGSHRNAIDKKGEELIQPNFLSKFSSRGPTVDGRIKPEVCGPGENVIVPKAGVSRPNWKVGTFTSCEVYVKSGTSYSTPVLAGVTTLVRQYFMEGYYPDGKKKNKKKDRFVPMGALLKAILVNSARPLFLSEDDGHYDPQAAYDQQGLPSIDQGWGGVDISTTLITPSSPRGAALKVFGKWTKGCASCPQLYEDQSCEYTFQISDSLYDINVPLKITLVWFDYHASDLGRQKTYNNLDLSVSQQGGAHGTSSGRDAASSATLYPNEGVLTAVPAMLVDEVSQQGGAHGTSSGRDAASSATTLYPNGFTSADEKNTVEHIAVPNPDAGTTYTVKVKGTSVPMPAQPFALVVSGPFVSSTVGVKYHDPKKESTMKKAMKRMKKRVGRCGS